MKKFFYSLVILALLLQPFMPSFLEATAQSDEPQPKAPEGITRYTKPLAAGDCTSWDSACDLKRALNDSASGDQIRAAAGTYKPDIWAELTDFTFVAWVWWNGGDDPAHPSRIFDFGRDANYYMHVTPTSSAAGGNPRFQIKSSATTQQIDYGTALPTGQWVHVAVTLQADSGALYLNGTAVMGTITLNPNQVVGNNLWLGRSQWYTVDPTFNGKIDEVAIFNRALSQDEINTVISEGWNNMPGKMVALHLDESPASNATLLNNSFENTYGGTLVTDNGAANKSVAGYIGNALSLDKVNDYVNLKPRRELAFNLKNGVALYGGYPAAGGDVRDWVNNITTLSGDIGVTDNINDNSFHVVTSNEGIPSNTVLDGFTITGGNANGTTDNLRKGGGIDIYRSSPTLTNLRIQGNRATNAGGGISNWESSPSISYSDFIQNFSNAGGGGMYNIASDPPLNKVGFFLNSAVNGAGMYNDHSSPYIFNSTFNDNYTSGTTGRGGGIYNFYYSNPTLSSVTFSNNKAQWGGGMYIYYHSNVLIKSNSIFTNNEAKADGGGLFSDDVGIITLSQVEFTGNKAGGWGGGMYFYSNKADLSYVSFNNNTANSGGGIFNFTEINLDHVTFSQNTATGKGGGLFNYTGSATLTNVTFSKNTVNPASSSWGGGMYSEGGLITIQNSTFQENIADAGGGLFTNGAQQVEVLNNVNFIKNQARLNGGGLHTLGGSSLVINYGKFEENSITGNNTTFGSGGGIYNIDSSLTLVGTQFISNTAFTKGGGMANSGASASLADVLFRGNKAPHASLGYGGGMYNTNSSPVLLNVTFELNQANNGGGMRNDANSKPSLTKVDFIHNHAVSGGGMYNEASSPTLTTVTFESNDATYGGAMTNGSGSNPVITGALINTNIATEQGGGILNSSSSPVITNVMIFNNHADTDGGGLHNNNSTPKLSEVIFSGNSAGGSGGGMYNTSSAPQIIQSVFYTNTAVTGGGGMYTNGCTQMSHVALTNVLFNANSANDPASDLDKGGGLYNNACPAVLTNVTMVHNQAGSNSGGIYATATPPVLQNSLLWGNTGAGTTSDDQFHTGTPAVPQNTTIQQSETDPSPFVDADGADNIAGTLDDNLYPTYPSGAIIDGGVENKLDLDGDYSMLDDVPFDLDGHSRIYADNDLDGLLDNLNDLDTDDKNQLDQGAYEAGCWAWHMKTAHEYLEAGRDYRYGFHYKVDQVTDPRTINQTLQAYALERANGNLDKARTSFEIAVGCSATIIQARQATRGILDVTWEKATGAMLQGNEEMVQVLDVTNTQESVTAEINQLKKGRDYYNEAVLGYLEPLASGNFDLLLETMTISTTHPITSTGIRTGLVDLERLLMASSRKGRANLELAERQFRAGMKADAGQTLDAAYNQAKAEMSLIYSLWPEAAELADYTDLLRSLGDMERLSGYLAAGKNPLGYDLDYIPFSYYEFYKNYNNYIQTKAVADDDLQDAVAAYNAVGAQQQEADDNWEKMQQNLQAAETLYNNKLVKLCGGSGGVPDRQHCTGGDIQEQREVVENAMLQVELVLQQMENQNALILIEQERVAAEKGIRYATAKLITDTGEELASYAKQEVEIELKKSTMEGIGGILSGFMGGFSPLGVATPSNISFGSRLFAGVLGGVTAGLEWQSQNKKADKLADIAAAKERLYAKQQAAVQYAEGDIAQANSLALQKQYMLKFAELDIDLAIALNNLQKELAHLVNLHNQAEYALAELVKSQAFTVMLYSDPAGRALRVRNMEMAYATYERALESAYKAGKALEYHINDEVTYDPGLGPLIALDQIFPLQNLFHLTQALDQMENAYQDWVPGPTGPARTNAYLSWALGFVDIGDDPENPDVPKEKLFNDFVKDPANRVDEDKDGCPELKFSFQTSLQSGNLLLLPDQVYNDRIVSLEMQIFAYDPTPGLFYGAEQASLSNISLTQAGTSILRTFDSRIHKGGDDDLRVYNLAPKSILIQANNMSYTGIPVTLLPNTEMYSRSVAATEWSIKIEGGNSAACGYVNLDNIGDINLIINHEYYALPQMDQDSLGEDEQLFSIAGQPVPLILPGPSLDDVTHPEASARPAATSADTDLDGLFVGALAMTQPLYIPATELRIWLNDAGGSLTGYISPTLAIPAIPGTGKGPTLTGSWSETSFSLQSQPFVTNLAPGLPITRTIYLEQGIIASTEITRSLSGVYLEILEGLTPEPLENRGVFRMERPLRLLQAGFGASPRSVYVGDNVFFSDLSLGNPTSWSWNFGDGTPVSTAQNPVHAYAAVGNYTVSLTISDGSGSNTLTLTEFISVEPPAGPPSAGFIANPLSGMLGMAVHFYDQSTGGATSWLWSFGDGGTSTIKNPTHVYSQPGVYTVSLKASNAYGQDTFTRVDYLTVESPGVKVFLPMIRK